MSEKLGCGRQKAGKVSRTKKKQLAEHFAANRLTGNSKSILERQRFSELKICRGSLQKPCLQIVEQF